MQKILLVMRLTMLLMIATMLHVYASGVAQTITLSGKDLSLPKVFSAIKKQTGYVVFCNRDLLNGTRPVTLDVKNIPLDDFMKMVVAGQPLSFVIADKTIILSERSSTVFKNTQEQKTETLKPEEAADPITGQLMNSGTREPVVGASITIKGSRIGTSTDASGKFSFNNVADNAVLVISSVGFNELEIPVARLRGLSEGGSFSLSDNAVTRQGGSFVFHLTESASSLDEVVAIGYAKVKRKDLTGATSSVTGDRLRLAPVTTAAQALQGKAAGVNIVTQSGAPGADINITVRSGSSITQGTAPLYIVDGFQMDNGLQNVDINDIDRIDVLKDASATAIYGSRGSNGVILISTKSAKGGKTVVSYNTYVGAERLGKKLPVLNALEYAKYQYEFQILAGKEANWAGYFGGNVSDPDFYTGAYGRINSQYASRPGIDWQDEIFGGSAITQNHNLSMNGGTDKTKYMISYNYTGQDGIFPKHGYNKNNIRVKLDNQLYKGIHNDFNVNFEDRKITGGGSLGGALKMTILQPPTGGAKFTDDQLINTDVSDALAVMDPQYDIYNPRITNDAVTQTSSYRQLNVNTGFDFDFLKDFHFRTAGSYTWYQQRDDYFDDGRTKTAENNLGPYGSRNNKEGYTWQISNTLSWAHKYNDHQLNVLVGQETIYSEGINLDNTYYKFPASNFGLNNVSFATSMQNIYKSGKNTNGIVSLFGRASYNYKGRYLANFTLRGDGSSKFAEGNRWGYFPSASAAWVISAENFMKDQNVVDNLKLRIGYGTSGNNNIADNGYATDYGGSSYAINNSTYSTLTPGNVLGNKKIQWETLISTNIGLDFSILKNRISGSVDLYNNESSNLLISNTLPPTTGYGSQFQNLGSIRNRGVEVELNSINLRAKNFRWSTDLNIAFNKSKVLRLNGIDGYNITKNYDSRVDFRITVGQPLGQFYGYRTDGVYTTDDFTQNTNGTYTLKNGVAHLKGATVGNIKPGDVKYKTNTTEKDATGNPVWSNADRTIIGNAQPKFQGGISNTFDYKGFSLTVFMNYSVGNDLFNMNSQRFIGPYLANQNTLDVMKNRFTLIDPLTGKETKDLARLAALNPNQHDPGAIWSLHPDNKIAISDALDYYLEDGSYLRISTVTLGYSIPRNVLKRTRVISTARLYCTVSNLYTFTKYKGYDPEVSATSSAKEPLILGVDNSAYPRAKGVVLGLNLSF